MCLIELEHRWDKGRGTSAGELLPRLVMRIPVLSEFDAKEFVDHFSEDELAFLQRLNKFQLVVCADNSNKPSMVVTFYSHAKGDHDGYDMMVASFSQKFAYQAQSLVPQDYSHSFKVQWVDPIEFVRDIAQINFLNETAGVCDFGTSMEQGISDFLEVCERFYDVRRESQKFKRAVAETKRLYAADHVLEDPFLEL